MRLLLGLAFGAALVSGLIITAPARLVYDALAPAGIEAGRVQGSVWRGEALRVQAGAHVLTHVETALEPLSVLSARPALAMTVTDPDVQLSARVQSVGDEIRIEGAEGIVSVSLLPMLQGLPLPSDSIARLDDVTVRLDREGRCLSAEGAVMSPALADAGARYEVDLPILDMTLYCAGEDLALNVSGQSPALALEGMIALEGPSPRYRIVATPRDPEGGRILSVLGFRADGAQWIADSEMREER